MNNQLSWDPVQPLAPRMQNIVGRRAEVDRLYTYLHTGSQSRFIYYYAGGGLGKTRMLEKLQQMVTEAGPGFYSCGIIDLYHTDTHSNSDVERAIVDGLDPQHKYFPEYRRERAKFELLRERGTDPNVLEGYREKLSRLFISDCRQMSIDVRKLIICFDTVEELQYESSVVEDQIGYGTADTRIRTWLLEKLAPLSNVLVVFAGRPKPISEQQTINHQERLIADMQKAFGNNLDIVELLPLNLEETAEFIAMLTGNAGLIPEDYLPIIHYLTDGKPIFLHLLVDLLQVWTIDLGEILDFFKEYQHLFNTTNSTAFLEKARPKIEARILNALLNRGGELGEYLGRLALLPKGVDAEILRQVLGLPLAEADSLLEKLAPLSFIKHYKALPGPESLHNRRTFLHDEMYRLLTNPAIIPRLRINERAVAHAVITNYYTPRINILEKEIDQLTPTDRISLRERLHKLQVERLYYLLVRDPQEGYTEYKRLTDQANRRRWVGFSMRLLDEFLRFYNNTDRRLLFNSAGISHSQVIKESTALWVERFYWWGQRSNVTRFAQKVLDNPQSLTIDPDTDIAILGNICGLMVDAYTDLHGYTPAIVDMALNLLHRLPALEESQPDQLLARARLSNAIGYQYRRGGNLSSAAQYYVEAKVAFRSLNAYQDELAIMLNNLAYTYAKQGRMALAWPLAREALSINETLGHEYSTGLSLSAMGGIALIGSNYAEALEYGTEALLLFRELEDVHGIVLAYLTLAAANRRIAKREFEHHRKLEEARKKLDTAHKDLERALQVAQNAGLESDLIEVVIEQGKVYRELGHLATSMEGLEKGYFFYRQSETALRYALDMKGWAVIDRANALQDLAEVLFASNDPVGAETCLSSLEALIETEIHLLASPLSVDTAPFAEQYFPLAKAEMMRGQMAFKNNNPKIGLQHYLKAYIYFNRFSLNAIENNNLLGYVYNHLKDLPVAEQQNLMDTVRLWIKNQPFNADLFLQALGDLLGV